MGSAAAGLGDRIDREGPTPTRTKPARLIGASPEMVALQGEIDRAARSDAKVLIMGESGVGKELVARGTHFGGARASMMFVPVNCAGLSETLLESELFGHVKGSFTDAYRDKPGTFERAHNGTVFLDEIGEMSLRMQGLLLRFLETGELQRVGADAGRHVNVRMIGATHRNLREMITQGTFREDLYYRLHVITISVPPLREHRSDIPQLVDHFLKRFVSGSQSPIMSVSPQAMRALEHYSWPGNVRELENVIERLVVTVHKSVIEAQDLPHEVSQDPVTLRARPDRRRGIADDLYTLMVNTDESFWQAVHSPYMARDISRTHVRQIVRRGLEEARGNYKIVAGLFNLEPRDYKRFLNFLREHDCQLPFMEYRSSDPD
jgi:transcriptional regulator with PAS, ATPase and Fis domain